MTNTQNALLLLIGFCAMWSFFELLGIYEMHKDHPRRPATPWSPTVSGMAFGSLIALVIIFLETL